MNKKWILKYDHEQFYFGNKLTKESQWEIPDGIILSLIIEPGWVIERKDGIFFFKNCIYNKKQTTIPASVPGKWAMYYTCQFVYFYNIETKKVQWEVPLYNTDFSSLKHEWSIYYKENIVYFVNNHGYETKQIPYRRVNCYIIKGLPNVENSCYIDSSLVALFSHKNSFTEGLLNNKLMKTTGYTTCGRNAEEDLENRINIQEQLKKLVKFVRGEIKEEDFTCGNLRLAIKKCNEANPKSDKSQNFWDPGKKDASEFLTWILSLFSVNTAKTETITYGFDGSDWKITTKIIDDKASIIQTIDYDSIKSEPSFISDYLPLTTEFEVESDQFTKRKTIISILSTPYLIFSFARIDPIRKIFLNRDVVPDKKIIINNKKFVLYSIVVYTSAHYICYFTCNKIWYLYNDLRTYITKIGTYKKMVISEPNPVKRGTLYFYYLKK